MMISDVACSVRDGSLIFNCSADAAAVITAARDTDR